VRGFTNPKLWPRQFFLIFIGAHVNIIIIAQRRHTILAIRIQMGARVGDKNTHSYRVIYF
jgi:hypothetical protein